MVCLHQGWFVLFSVLRLAPNHNHDTFGINSQCENIFYVSLFLIKHVFSVAMVELDGDDIRISSRGKLAERDIVQVRRF